jgi:CBS domain-containing protein
MKMKARDIMSSDLECVTREDSLQQAARLMRDHDIGALPVVEDTRSMKLIGVITDRDIAVRHVAEGNDPDSKVGDYMTSGNLYRVSPDDDLESVTRTMESHQVRRVPVCEGDRVVGMIAQADIALNDEDDRRTGEVVERISEPGHGR